MVFFVIYIKGESRKVPVESHSIKVAAASYVLLVKSFFSDRGMVGNGVVDWLKDTL